MHILIVRPGAIGDTLLTLPVIQALREQYKNAYVTLVSHAAVLPLAQATGIVDEVHDYQAACWSHLFLPPGSTTRHDSLLDQILQRTHMAICWLHDPDGAIELNLRSAGIAEVIIAAGRPDTLLQTTHITTHLLRSIGLVEYLPLKNMVLTLPDSIPLAHKSALIALHPGSGGSRKCWPVEHFATAIQALWQQNLPVLILAGPAEQERLQTLQALLAPFFRPDLCTYLINAPLITIAQRLRQCNCYIGNDSGLTHLAALLGLPTLALFGPSDPAIWHPPGPAATVLRAYALDQLEPDVVLNYVTQIVQNHDTSSAR